MNKSELINKCLDSYKNVSEQDTIQFYGTFLSDPEQKIVVVSDHEEITY